MGKVLATFALAVATALPVLPATPATAAPAQPGFLEATVLSGLVEPTAVRFANDGRVFVAEKRGLVKVFDGLGDPTPTTFADLRTKVHNFWDRGLLGLALDPGFPANPFVYVLYTHDAPVGGTAPQWGAPGTDSDPCPSPPGPTTDGCVVSGRLSRLQAAGNIMTGGEQVLIDDWCAQFPSHTIGSLAFGPDGALYVTGGDGASFTFTDYGQAGAPLNPCGDPPAPAGGVLTPPTAQGGALRSQDLRTSGDPVTLDGAVLRVDPATGDGLPSNPMASSTDANARRVVAYGLRNPFRFAVRPGTSEIWLGDVGWNATEEINRIVSASDSTVENFGWPCLEGAVRQPGYDGADLSICETLYGQAGAVTSPYFSYSHSGGIVTGESCGTADSSISGMAFYNGGSYPSAYNGALFFADYSRSCIWAMQVGTNGLPDPARRSVFATGVAPVDLQTGPGGDLFYVDIASGTVRRISFSSANQPPVASASASPTSGPAPLTVTFDATASRDPEGGALTYAWDLDGDGAFDDSTASRPGFTYTTPRSLTVRVKVTDTAGVAGIAGVVIDVDDVRPTPTITTPVPGSTWAVGQSFGFSGGATDPQDGTMAASRLSWSLVMHHCGSPSSCHEHPLQTFAGVASGSFTAPDHSYPSYLELSLTATDSSGLGATTTLRLDPRVVPVTVTSNPVGLSVSLDSETAPSPLQRTCIIGSVHSISTASPQTLGGVTHTFTSWSDGGERAHNVTIGQQPTTLIAGFTAPTGSVVHRIDVGGPGVSGTPAWSPDTAASPSSFTNAAATGNRTAGTTSPITLHASVPAGTPTALFQTERYDPEGAPEMAWDLPVTAGSYEVRLYFAETYSGAFAVGARTFDVAIEGAQLLNDFDVFATAGAGNRGIMRAFTVTADANLDIDFAHVVENPALTAIEVVRGGAPGPPQLGATPTDVAFGPVPPGTTASRSVSLTNLAPTGGASITVDATSIAGAQAARFGDSFNDATNVVLAPGQSTSVTVTFSPTTAGAHAATLNVVHNGANTPLAVPLSGDGAGAGSVVHRVNAGGAAVTGTPTWTADTAASPSPFTNAVATGNRTASTPATIALDPSVPAGTPMALFQTERWDPESAPEMAWDFPVTAGSYEVRLYFAETYSGAFSAGARQFDVSIEGAQVLNDFDVFATAGAGNRGIMRAFTVTADANLDIDFAHVVENPALTAIEIVRPGAPGPPQLGASPASAAFGAVTTGTTASRTVSLTNLAPTGGASITVDATSIVGAQAARFGDSFNDATNVVLAPGQSTSVTVTFSPTTTGAHAATLNVVHNGANTPLTVPLSGDGATAGSPVVHRIDVGGPGVSGTPAWSPDTTAAPSSFTNAAAAASRAAAVSAAITLDATVPAGTPTSLFQTERYDPSAGAEMAWDLPVTAGSYEVRLYFAETYSGAFSVGARLFDVAIEGAQVLNDFDVFAAAGAGNRGIMRSFVVTADANLDIDFAHVAENPALTAIEIVRR